MASIRLTTAGESHGPAEVCILEGVPSGLVVSAEAIDPDLARRQGGYGRGGRMKIEQDRVKIVAGIRLGRTLGTPIAMEVENRDHANWRPAMQPEPDPEFQPERVSIPRPGHADLAGLAKFGHDDVRDVLERASARETVMRVAAGAVVKRLLSEVGVKVRARVIELGGVKSVEADEIIDPAEIDWEAVEASPFGCADGAVEAAMRAAVDGAREGGESLGGVFEIWAWEVCPGLGSYASFDRRLDGALMGALGSIPAIKGVEIGQGFRSASLPGSAVHDPILLTSAGGHCSVTRASNRAGGVEGGVTNGMPVVVRAAMKPIPTLMKPLPSVDLSTLEPVAAHKERSDVTAVPAARVVGEAMVALVIANAYLEKFGGDSVDELRINYENYVERLEGRGLWRRS